MRLNRKDEELDHMLKFNTYKVSPRLLSEKPDEILQFIQSVPLFSPGHGLVLDQVESIVLSSCATVAAVSRLPYDCIPCRPALQMDQFMYISTTCCHLQRVLKRFRMV